MLLCDRAEALKARELAQATGIRHDVIHVSRSPKKSFVAIIPHTEGEIYALQQRGTLTTLYRSDEPIP
jgi:hypothetical protein